MNTTVPWNIEGAGDGTREAALAAARRSGQVSDDWLDGIISEHFPSRSRVGRPDHQAEMQAIADQMERLTDTAEAARAAGGRGRGATARRHAPAAGAPPFDARVAVAEIARRQADLDGHGEAPAAPPPLRASASRAEITAGLVSKTQALRRSLRDSARARSPSTDAPAPPTTPPRGSSDVSRGSTALSAEVSQTFARFSRDLHDAIAATDARPGVEALDRHMRHIGRAIDGLGAGIDGLGAGIDGLGAGIDGLGAGIDGLGAGLAPSDAITRIGEQTREMRDLLRTSALRSVPLDALERQVASLESRLGRLAVEPPVPAPPAPPSDFSDALSEVRALFDDFKPGATLAAMENRLDDITARIERGLATEGPAGLIEGLSRRVDEIHASLRSQMAASAVDTRPLEGLVRGLSDRIGQAREASADFQQLEAALRDVAAKVDGAAGMTPRAVQGIEGQLARLAERLDRSEASLKSLDGVEQALGELFSQFEVTRQVAIDAAETAARTAARDTLRAALQNPGLSHRPAEVPAALAEQVARGLDDLRAMQDQAERRMQTTLSDIRVTVERLAQGMGRDGTMPVVRAAAEEPRRRRAGPPPAAADASRVAIDPADMLIEPGRGAAPPAQPSRAEPRFDAEPDEDAPPPVVVSSPDAEGPASFIAAARRAAQAAQASAAAAAAAKATDRRPVARVSGDRPRETAAVEAQATSTLDRAKAFVARRRRPLLLGLAALVMLVGAFEVVKLSVAPDGPTRAGQADTVAPARPHLAAAATDEDAAGTPPKAAVASAAAVATAAPPARAPLPTFVAGAAKAPPAAPVEGIGEGLRSLASGGDAGAQYEVGLRYADGRGVSRDPRQAVAWFQKAAAQGSAPAEYRLGSAYEKGVGADRDPALAMAWYGKAAEAGNIRAMHNLAVMSAEGAAGKPDYAKAAQWFGKASLYGVRDSQFNLAILCARGLGIEQSLTQSYTWFAIAAAEGDDDAAKKRDEVAAKLDSKVLTSAQAAAAAFKAAVPAAKANEVAPPPGGWDAVAPRGTNSTSPASPSSSPAKVSQL